MSNSDMYETHRYRLIWWKRWPLFIIGLLVIEILRTFPQVLININSLDVEQAGRMIGFLTLLMLIILGLLLMLASELLFSYLEVGPGGIRLSLWPYQKLDCTWDEVESIYRSRVLGIYPYDAINLIKAQRVSFYSTTLFKQMIVLSDFRGWPKGRLADDIRFYAPRLFVQTEKLQSTQQ